MHSNTKSFLIVFLISFAGIISAHGQKGYQISLDLGSHADSSIYLANYFGSKLYYTDTAQVNKKGIAVFEGDKALGGGKYAFVLPGPKLFEVLIDEDQFFEMSTDTLDFIKNMKVKGSKANEVYYGYIKYINEKKQEVAKLNALLIEFAEDSVKSNETSTQLVQVNKDVQAYQRKMLKENPDNWGAQIVGMTIPVEVPEPPRDENGVITDSMYQYMHYINHFFDNVPLEKAWIARTPEFDKKFKDYFNTALLQSPDTVAKYADEFIKKVEYDDELFKFCIHYLTYNFETSKIMGMDAAFVHMVENYYMTGRTPWMDSTNLASVTDRALRMKPTLIGQKAPIMNLHDSSATKFTSLYDVKADFTVVYIWDPDCGHCKKENPKMVDLGNKYKDSGVKVYSVGNPHENEEWIEYLHEHPEMDVLINVSDSPKHPDYFRTYYDVHSTPVILLLDEDKKIIAKKVGTDQLDQILEKEISRKIK